MEKQNHKAGVKAIIVVLLVLVFVAIILVVVNVFVLLTNKNDINNLGDDNLAKECLKGDNEDWMGCLEDKSLEYYDEGDCGSALKVYEDVPPDWVNEYVLADLYNEAYSLSLSCDDLSLQHYWGEKFNDLSKQLEGMD